MAELGSAGFRMGVQGFRGRWFGLGGFVKAFSIWCRKYTWLEGEGWPKRESLPLRVRCWAWISGGMNSRTWGVVGIDEGEMYGLGCQVGGKKDRKSTCDDSNLALESPTELGGLNERVDVGAEAGSELGRSCRGRWVCCGHDSWCSIFVRSEK